jgi:primosomal protein N'
MPEVLSGPVDVCVAVPRLAVDRPFTYLLSEEQDAGVGSLVSVPFHGRAVNGWVLGAPSEVPAGRILPIKRVRSHVRFFDDKMLRLLRWMSERYIAPLATVIERSYPPRVVSEEHEGVWAAVDAATPARSPTARSRGAPGGYAPPSPATREASSEQGGELVLFSYPLLVDEGQLSVGADALKEALEEQPFVEVHPAEAERLGLGDGAAARVRTEAGQAELPVRITDSIARGAVFVPYNQRGFAANSILSGSLITSATLEPVQARAEVAS